ncbi:MAG: FISUMP domain-containing protein [Bacteroidota bacterium]
MKKPLNLLLIIISLSACKQQLDTLKDGEGNIYRVKAYGSQIWMTENLKVKKDATGQPIKFYYPNGNPENILDYGLLYDFETACRICPPGWRLPNNEDWESLFQLSEKNDARPFKDRLFWKGEKNSNVSGFSGRPTGYGNQGEFDNFFPEKTLFWSQSPDT